MIEPSEAPRKRGRLKVYLGYAAGVGKTFAMLEAARELFAAGTSVVVGIVESRGRYDTASLVLGLPLLPRRRIEQRGRSVEELDLEGALARRPGVLLVDELHHTNAPGQRHEKRWQDVLDLLDAGIDVHTTLNVQHVESLNDVVRQITTVRVRETVPDALLDRADEVELVDLPPETLLRRMEEGKVTLPEEAARAGHHLFRRGSLLALRELALRRAAERVDADVQAYREEHAIEAAWPAAERILVGVGPSPASARLVRAARRIAAGLRAPWVAAYVNLAQRPPESREARERIDAHLRLAESLGGEVVRLTGTSVGDALFDHARRHNVTRIVLGKPTHARIFNRLRSSVLDDVVRGSGDIDVHVISGDETDPGEGAAERSGAARSGSGHVWAALLVGAATAAGWASRAYVAQPDVAVLYLLTIVLVAMRFGRGPSIVAAALSVAAYDFFFVPPFFTFAVSDLRNVLTFAVMFGAGLLLSALTLRIRRQGQSAREREQRTAALYALSRELGTAIDADDIAAVVARQAAGVFRCGAAVLVPGVERGLVTASRTEGVPEGLENEAISRWVLEHGRPAGVGTGTLPGASVSCFPIASGTEVLGVLALSPPEGGLGTDERHTVMAFARQAAIALARARLEEEAKAAALRARTEEIRSSLLSTVSHDLRTPLASITGAATTLRDRTASLAEPEREGLLESICDEADRLERLVKNLLEMTRIESGGIELKREWVPLEEIVGSALTRLEQRLAGRAVTIDLPADLPLVPVDPLLVEQVFLNLFDNADKYTPAASPIEVSARADGGAVTIEVADRGPGFAPGTEARVFDKFFRGSNGDARGAGLGLAICKGVADAHGGGIAAENREGGGAVFRLRLPLIGTPPVVARAPDDAERRPDAGGAP